MRRIERLDRIVTDSSGCLYLHPDHLNTPRLVADATGSPVWRWDQQEPFGNTVPDENPSSLGAFDLPLRLPGQYFDKETGLHYNYFRDYDPSLGIYKQSDPIGLRGGLNTYTYGSANPLFRSDFSGLLSPYHHATISYDAFAGSPLSKDFALEVAKEAVRFDFLNGTQEIDLAHTHSQSRPRQDSDEARKMSDSFVNYQLSLCTLRGLGWALHAIQDRHGRGHTEFSEYQGFFRIGMIFHAIDDWWLSSERKAAALAASKALIQRYQQICPQSCR